MAYLETNNQIKFVLTKAGKEIGLKDGFLNVFKYFTVSDKGVIYTMDVQPDKFTDLNGSHSTSTNIPNGTSIIIDENAIEKVRPI